MTNVVVGIEGSLGLRFASARAHHAAFGTDRGLVPPRSLEVGTVFVLRTHVRPLSLRVEAEHVHYERGVEFCDRMRRGPFAHW